MRIRTGHGPNDWTPSIPASPGSMPIRGSNVVEASRPAKGAGLTPSQRKPDDAAAQPNGRPRLSDDIDMIGRGKRPGYATEEERVAARRQAWRESEQRKRDQQRDHRSKVRAEIAAIRDGRAA